MKKILSFLFLTISITTFAQEDNRFDEVSKERQSSEPTNEVEDMPEFPGGEKGMIAYLNKNIKYPKTAQENDKQGTVNIECIINEDGTLSNVKVLSGFDQDCNQEAMRVVREMPKWKPGRQNGRPVKVFYTIPIVFRLD